MLIFIDLETTGLEQEDKVCSISIIYTENEELKTKYEVVNEGKKITSKASSINHITNEMLVGKSSLFESEILHFLRDNNTLDTTLVGHNINHDLQKLLGIGFIFKGSIIDTRRISKHLIQECESYSLQFLRYELKLYRKEEADTLCAHNALSDAKIVRLLYLYLLEIVSIDEMYTLSMKNVLIEKFEFGKYKGRYIEEICEYDRNYIEWMLGNMDLDEDLKFSISSYLQF